jgi:hypothetical protein
LRRGGEGKGTRYVKEKRTRQIKGKASIDRLVKAELVETEL